MIAHSTSNINLYVSHLPHWIDEQKLRKIFLKYEIVESGQILRDDAGSETVSACIKFSEAKETDWVLQYLHKKILSHSLVLYRSSYRWKCQILELLYVLHHITYIVFSVHIMQHIG